ncbi:MAG: FAD binding domain-containing protein, partial [Proteobacteria bacterium]|nr:FAD binding domain-containing protein [Pseudomonadota bacterium]MBU1583393.1 FAD binding domain-containing protein [Pseudomonadota bacterium]
DRHKDNAGWFGNGTFINNGSFEFHHETVIHLENLNLTDIKETPDTITIGASVTLQELMDSDSAPQVLKEAALHETSRHIRNMRTLGGDIGIGTVYSNTIPCLVALSACVKTCDAILLLEEYLINKNSLILEIIIPKSDRICRLKKVSLQSNSPTIFTAAVSMEKDKKIVEKMIIALGGIKAAPIRLVTLENDLVKGLVNPTDTTAIKKAVASNLNLVSDINGSTEYKKYIAGISVADCITRCFQV